jgi:hypothetical protein
MESPSSGAAEKAKFHDGRLKPYPHEELGTPNDVCTTSIFFLLFAFAFDFVVGCCGPLVIAQHDLQRPKLGGNIVTIDALVEFCLL